MLMESKKIYLIIAVVVVVVIAGLFHLRERRQASLLEAKYSAQQVEFDLKKSGSMGKAGPHE